MVVAPTSGYMTSHRTLRGNGLLVTLGTLIVIEGLNRTVIRVPTPGAILLLPVAYATFTGGLRTGLISATCMFLYALYFFAVPNQFLQYTDSNILTIIVLTLLAVAMVAMIGRLKQRIEHLNRYNQLILHSAGEGICGLDAQGMITFLNPAAATMCGWLVTDLSGKSIQTLLRHPLPDGMVGTPARARGDAAELDASATTVTDAVFWRRDDTAFPVEYTSSPIWEHHKVVGMVVTFRDISERKQVEAALREREASFRLLFANNPMPMWVFDRHTLTFLEVNEAAIAHYGYAQNEFLQMRVSDIRPPDEVPLLKERIGRMNMRLDTSGPWQHYRKDGTIIIVLVYSHVLVLKEREVVLAVVEDITERQAAEVALQHMNADLERRVVERTAQLEATNKELESFSYSVSHDLRAPLRSIDGFSQALLEDYGDQLDAAGRDYLQRVRAATQRMAQLIDDLLSLARVTRSELRHDLVDLSAHATAITDELQRTQPDRQITFVIAPGLTARADERLIHVVLENLLANAWKFTGKCACPQIEFGVAECDGLGAYFVRDNGAGFDMAYADKLFGAFQRLHAMTEFAGTGIGLATVQRVIHRHGGRVWAESALGQGATFFFSLGTSFKTS